MLLVREIRTPEQLEALRPVWNGLLRRSGRPSVYLTFEWLATWWRCFEDDRRELFVLVVEEAGSVLGIAPMMKVQRRFFGIPYVKIEFISARDYAFSHLTMAGSLEFILTERKQEIVGAVVSYLAARPAEWAFLRLEPLTEDSPTLALIVAESEARHLKVRRGDSALSYEIHVGPDWQKYFSERPVRFRKNLRRDDRLLYSQGEVCFLHRDSLEQVEQGFDDVIDIERRSWKWSRGLSINCVGYRGFFQRFAEEASRNGWLRLSFLRLNGTNIAYCYSVAFEGTEACFKTSYDQSYRQISPGSLLQWRRFEYGVQRGTAVYDLMAGAPEYKKYWSTNERRLHEIFVFNGSLRSKVIYVLFFTLHLYGKFRLIPDLGKRLLRRLGITLRHSELTRTDQLESRNASDGVSGSKTETSRSPAGPHRQ